MRRNGSQKLRRKHLEPPRRIVTPHAQIAALFTNVIKLAWERLPEKTIEVDFEKQKDLIVFFGPTLARKGAYVVRELVKQLGFALTVVGAEFEEEHFWRGLPVTHTTLQQLPWRSVHTVLQPALFEYWPRHLLRAYWGGSRLVVSPFCGIEEDRGRGIYHVPFGETGLCPGDYGVNPSESRKLIMGLKILIALIAVIPLPALAATNSTVIAATATSSSTQAASVNCLLKSDCPGSWSPGTADSGANEGVYVQSGTAVDSDTVELLANVKDVKAPFTVSVNGALVPRSLSAKSSAENGAGRYAARYAIPGSRIKSMFFRLGIEKGGWQNFSLYAIRFVSREKVSTWPFPLLVASSVTASSVLEPSVAYQAANLFDSRYDFAWSTNGKTTSGKGESFEVRFRFSPRIFRGSWFGTAINAQKSTSKPMAAWQELR